MDRTSVASDKWRGNSILSVVSSAAQMSPLRLRVRPAPCQFPRGRRISYVFLGLNFPPLSLLRMAIPQLMHRRNRHVMQRVRPRQVRRFGRAVVEPDHCLLDARGRDSADGPLAVGLNHEHAALDEIEKVVEEGRTSQVLAQKCHPLRGNVRARPWLQLMDSP